MHLQANELPSFSARNMFQQGYATVMLFDSKDIWPMATTFGISGGLNITIAALAYVWLQKPYVFKLRGRVTVMDEAEYWTFKSLFVCGVFSLYNAIGVSIMGLSLGWLMITFVLGNLYTLSVMLSVAERRPSAPSSFVLSVSPEPRSETSSTRRDSTATLTPDESLWNDIVKSQSTYPVRPTSMRVVNPDVSWNCSRKYTYV
ncbi:hypothetical protein C8Q77DRAFT_1123046 [Trametes polyzona]|nr:hypothetical protein C8Q77DRAFT_1123046 [Trametes polyzona]